MYTHVNFFNFLKAHEKLYKMVYSAQKFGNSLILVFSPTYGFLPKIDSKLTYNFIRPI